MSRSIHQWPARGLAVLGLVLGLALGGGSALAQSDTSRSFADTGFSVPDDAVWNFFNANGGAATFGEPISREFTFQNATVQLFQNAALQVQPDGSVQVLPLATLLPYTELQGLSVPAASDALTYVAPSPDQPNYAARLQVFLDATVQDTFNGQPTNFSSTYLAQGGPAVWGLPTSNAAADRNNPNFIYQRFQNGILMYDATAGTTQALPLGEYFRDILTNQDLPPDLAAEAARSPLLGLAATNGVISEVFAPDPA